MLKLIIFDFDNTVFDYSITEKIALERAFNECHISYNELIYDKFRSINRNLWLLHNEDSSKVSLNDLKVLRFHKLIEQLGLSYSIAETLSALYTEFSKEGSLVEGVETLINQLYPKYHLAIASNGSYIPRKEKLSRSALSGKMDFFSPDYLLEGIKKPDPAFYYKIAEYYGISDMSQVMAVGDELKTDILCASQAGIKSIWFRNHQSNTFENVKPDYIIDNMNELLDIIVLENQ